MITEREKMLRGDLYNAADPELVQLRRRARELTYTLNHSREDEADLRQKIYRELFGRLDGDVWIEPPFYCDYGLHINLGANVFFNFNCIILDVAPVTIGRGVLFGPNVQIYTATHPLDVATRSTGAEFGKPIAIGDDCWIGGSAVILPGVTIGAGTTIGAGSMVTRDIPAGVFAAGNPCRVIRALE